MARFFSCICLKLLMLQALFGWRIAVGLILALLLVGSAIAKARHGSLGSGNSEPLAPARLVGKQRWQHISAAVLAICLSVVVAMPVAATPITYALTGESATGVSNGLELNLYRVDQFVDSVLRDSTWIRYDDRSSSLLMELDTDAMTTRMLSMSGFSNNTKAYAGGSSSPVEDLSFQIRASLTWRSSHPTASASVDPATLHFLFPGPVGTAQFEGSVLIDGRWVSFALPFAFGTAFGNAQNEERYRFDERSGTLKLDLGWSGHDSELRLVPSETPWTIYSGIVEGHTRRLDVIPAGNVSQPGTSFALLGLTYSGPLTATPEPAAWEMLALGAGLLAITSIFRRFHSS